MTDLTTNAGQLAERYRARGDAVVRAARSALSSAALAVEREMVKRLSGSGAPWSYPVPVRTGHLRRSTFVQRHDTLAIVGNRAAYASAIHTGQVAEWAGHGKHRQAARPARPFLDDAVKDVDPAKRVTAAIVAALEHVA